MTHTLGYFGPRPESQRRWPSPWLVAGVIVALAGFCLLAAMAVPVRTRPGEARIAAASMDVAYLSRVLGTFARDTGRFPSNAEGLAALSSPPAGISGWNGPYVQQLKNDPWGRPYAYRLGGPKGGAGFRVVSMGGDGLEGTGDDIVHGSDAAPPASTIPPVTRPSSVTEP